MAAVRRPRKDRVAAAAKSAASITTTRSSCPTVAMSPSPSRTFETVATTRMTRSRSRRSGNTSTSSGRRSGTSVVAPHDICPEQNPMRRMCRGLPFLHVSRLLPRTGEVACIKQGIDAQNSSNWMHWMSASLFPFWTSRSTARPVRPVWCSLPFAGRSFSDSPAGQTNAESHDVSPNGP